jgi:hypothetical protein
MVNHRAHKFISRNTALRKSKIQSPNTGPTGAQLTSCDTYYNICEAVRHNSSRGKLGREDRFQMMLTLNAEGARK